MDKQPIPDFLPNELPQGGPKELPHKHTGHDIPKGLLEAMRAAGAPEEALQALKDGRARALEIQISPDLPPEMQEKEFALKALEMGMVSQLQNMGSNPCEILGERPHSAGHKVLEQIVPDLDKLFGSIYEKALKETDGDLAAAAKATGVIYESIAMRLRMEALTRYCDSLCAVIATEMEKKPEFKTSQKTIYGPAHVKQYGEGLIKSENRLVPKVVKRAMRRLLDLL